MRPIGIAGLCSLFVVLTIVPSLCYGQVIVGRELLSDGKENNFNPMIAAAGSGRYAVTWQKQDYLNETTNLRARGINAYGKTTTPIRSGIAPTLYGYWSPASHDLVEIGGTKNVMEICCRSSDYKWIMLGFDSGVKRAKFTTIVDDDVTSEWRNASFYCAPSGVVCLYETYWSGSWMARFGPTGAFLGKQKLPSTNPAKYSFVPSLMAWTPSGYLITGEESTGTKERPEGIYLTSSLVVPGKGSGLANYFKYLKWVRAAFLETSGMLFFFDDYKDKPYLRKLSATGVPSGGNIRFAESSFTSYVDNVKWTALMGRNKYALTWAYWGDMYLQLFSDQGITMGTPFAIGQTKWNHYNLRWDKGTGRLLVVHRDEEGEEIYVTVVQID